MELQDIKDRLQNIEAFKELDPSDIDWMASNSELLSFEKGETLFKPNEPADNLYIILHGSFDIYFERDGRRNNVSDLKANDITGLLPYSRMKEARAAAEALETSKVLALHRGKFNEMICERHQLTSVFVHIMTDRTRNFTTMQQQNEKLASLGKLSAGLAHELNNPSAAIVRSSEALKQHLQNSPDKFKRVMEIDVTPEQVDLVNELLFERMEKAGSNKLTLMERTALEDDLADWMDNKNINESMEWAEVLAEYGFLDEDFDRINKVVPDENLRAVIGWITSNLITDKMVDEIADASHRISDLVGSIKSYTHMDQAQDKQATNLHAGLQSTVTMLGHKLRANKVSIQEDFADIPKVPGYPGEINQVFTNIIDNALDAMADSGGTLTLKTELNENFVLVKISDTGSGIPDDIVEKIFDPFFTTKDMGQGTGMGLDLVMKIMKVHHRGDIKVDSQPGATTFTLCFPKNL